MVIIILIDLNIKNLYEEFYSEKNPTKKYSVEINLQWQKLEDIK